MARFRAAMDLDDLVFAGAAEQARRIAARHVSSRELVSECLARIERLQPQLNAFRVVFAERAMAEADQADARLGAGDERLLLGVPVAIKDDADVAGHVTAYGHAGHDGTPAEHDSEVVRRLRQAGAVLVGKTHVPELTQWPFTETLAFGATRNPWNLAHTPGGSSGGSGAAVAAGLCGVALGSDGAGSIRIPGSFCGLFGLKPQRDRISLAPKREGWHGLNHFGPLARRVADAALFLDATSDGVGPAGGWVQAAATRPERLRVAVSVKPPPGVVARLGVQQRDALLRMADVLRSLGHDVQERELDYGPRAWANVVTRYLRGIHDDVARVAHPERLERRSRGMARLGGVIAPSVIARVRAGERALTARIGAIFEHADLVMLPGPTGPPFTVGELHARGALWTLNAVAARVPYYGVFNATGQPAASVPAGFDATGLPLSVQLVARPHDEATLLSLAAELEEAAPWAQLRPPLG
jgi:amidase